MYWPIRSDKKKRSGLLSKKRHRNNLYYRYIGLSLKGAIHND